MHDTMTNATLADDTSSQGAFAAPRLVARPAEERREPLRTTRLNARDIRGDERSALVARLFRIYNATSAGIVAADFETEVFRTDETRLALFHAGDKLVGFSYATIARVEHEGREHAVFGAGTFFLPGYRGGAASGIFGITEALRFKLREPRTPLSYIARASSPAPYALFDRIMPCMHPRPNVSPSAGVEGLVRAVAALRGLEHTAEGAWLVRSTATPQNPGRASGSGTLRSSPAAAFFLRTNPDFARGTALLVWIRLDAVDIATALVRALREYASR
jgi:hypothetical protein